MIASQSFDAWGRYRNPSDWTYNNVPTQPDWLYRGFTGHEHLKEFVLVNMNGRMYDPVLGRVMSPDNYVSLPWSTQGYNRYGYGLNNPLIITDPDGEWIHILIGALIGGAINLTVKWISGDIHSFGQGVGAFLTGAAAGAIATATGGAALSLTGLSASTIAGGAVAGAVGAAFSSPVLGLGNHVFFGDSYSLKNWAMDVAVGGVVGGIAGGIAGKIRGSKNIWTGREPTFNRIGELSSTTDTRATIDWDPPTAQMPDYITPDGRVIPGGTYTMTNAAGSTGSSQFTANWAAAFRAFTKGNFRHNLGQLTGKLPADAQAHHVFPQKFVERFAARGINIHDPKFGVWWETTSHLENAAKYNNLWEEFLNTNPTQLQILDKGREFMQRFGFNVNY